MGDVAADVGKVRFLGEFHHLIHAVVKIVISGNRDVVSEIIHQTDDGFAFGQGSENISLGGIAVIDEKGGDSLFFEGFPHLAKADNPESIVDAAVNIAGIENHNILRIIAHCRGG